MVNWLQELEALPLEAEKSKAPVSIPDKTDETQIEDVANRLEAAEERAAIMEYDGGLSRNEAEIYAVNVHLRSFIFTTTDGEGTYLGRVETIEEARKALEFRFGKKLIRVMHNH